MPVTGGDSEQWKAVAMTTPTSTVVAALLVLALALTLTLLLARVVTPHYLALVVPYPCRGRISARACHPRSHSYSDSFPVSLRKHELQSLAAMRPATQHNINLSHDK